ncbi:phage portal protein family protein [Parasedimentitalea huanghaiensis]|uniref:DUF935 family protein n=1 Tax=Parasedimentitalea huanghaiensis TaxID=2682100 RepID=A0A6L6WMH9_9RHOB|nr:DUF935 family protein [Zongyanglinia huanghaiensis]
MAKKPQIYDAFGRPLQRANLTKEIMAPTVGSVRSPISGYPADGLEPQRLANILRAADAGDPVRYLELAETIEERDAHYLAVVGTRKRAVSQLEMTVEPGGDSTEELSHADMVRNWLKRDELTAEIFDILDAVGKGYSFTEIIWGQSMGQYFPERLEWRDPRWFRFDRHDLKTPVMLSDTGQEEPLEPFRFIYAPMQAKSGLALRGGLARVASWAWMFKAFTQRDWAIFTQTYGQPLRVGKYGPGASEDDKDKLFQAVAEIAGDCAAIVPDSMSIDFVEAKSLGSSTDHYERRCDWLDKQTSKAVLGQTATTDAETGGMGSGKEHREVQEDIERADARLLAAILNRNLIRPWIDIEYGPQNTYPRLIIARPEVEDLKAWTDAVTPWVDVGLEVEQEEVRAKFGLKAPKAGAKILGRNPQSPDTSPNSSAEKDQNLSETKFKHRFKGLDGNFQVDAALQSENASQGDIGALAPTAVWTGQFTEAATPALDGMLQSIEAMLAAATTMEEFREFLLEGYPDLNSGELAKVMGEAFAASFAGGRATLEDDASA